MQMSESDLRRVKKRLNSVGYRLAIFSGWPLILLVVVLILASTTRQGLPTFTNSKMVLLWVVIVCCCLPIGIISWKLYRRFANLRLDLKEQKKKVVLATVLNKDNLEISTNQLQITILKTYYLVFDFGRVEVGERLYQKAKPGQLLTLVLSTHGHELLAVSEAGIETVPWQL